MPEQQRVHFAASPPALCDCELIGWSRRQKSDSAFIRPVLSGAPPPLAEPPPVTVTLVLHTHGRHASAAIAAGRVQLLVEATPNT